ncbi:MAG: CHASE domain-containing protein [Elusimicrobia bacterium]|nr:CHASE domain-containing protein [Elusimicrobiota bacterium]
MDRQARDLGNFADQMGRSPELAETTFQEVAVRLLREAPLFSAVTFLNDRFRREWVFPFAAGRGVKGTELNGSPDELGAAKRSLKTGQPAASGLLTLTHGEKGIHLYVPVFRESLWQGLVEGPIQVGRLALELIGPSAGKDFIIRSSMNGKAVKSIPPCLLRTEP